MRIAHVVLPRASEYEKKSQRIDFEAFGHAYEVTVVDHPRKAASADVTQIYGPPSSVGGTPVSPLTNLPEAVAEEYFRGERPSVALDRKRIGSFRRRSIARIVDQAAARLHRTREDIDWLLFDRPPSAADFAQLDAWIDPVTEEDDYDGFVAEALVSGKLVIASRTAINSNRLEKGRTGLLVPPNDANELTHAILAALFKTEVAQQKTEAARQTISKFHPRQRFRALTRMLETLRS